MKRVFGAMILCLGVLLAAWIGYNYFIEMQPAAAGRNPVAAIVMSAAFIFVGLSWIQNKSA